MNFGCKLVFHRWLLAGLALLLASSPGGWAAGSIPPADSRRLAAARVWQQAVPGGRVDWDEELGTPKWVHRVGGWLTELPTNLSGDPDQACKDFLATHADLFGFGAEVLLPARVLRRMQTPRSGLRTVVWQQQAAGVPVFEGILIAHTTREGRLVSLSSRFLPALFPPTISEAANLGIPEALHRAAGALDVGFAAGAVREVVGGPGAASGWRHFTAPGLSGMAATRAVWLPDPTGRLQPAWEIILTSRASQEMHQLVVDAGTGAVARDRVLTEHLTPASYLVFFGDSPTPLSPSYSSPTNSQPAVVDRKLVTTNAWSVAASPNGWINDGDNQTLGNNVDAFLDWNGDGTPAVPRPQGNPFRVFAPALYLTMDPATYGDASVVNLFFWNNWIHDQLYDLGFTEAAGNFQTDNFGRGGQGQDAVKAQAQDGGGGANDNNARFSTPPDGLPGVMEMYVWTGATPSRDGAFDTMVILHEYTHGLSNRRVGGGIGITALQSRGLGEGWSDFYSLAMLRQPGDDPNGTYPEAPYVAAQSSGFSGNYYFGIRRYPYCTDLAKDPVTFKDIDPNQADPHAGVPLSPAANAQPGEIHNQGEVWCAALWDARANLIQLHGAPAGNQMMLQLVTDAMNLTPPNPTFIQARDALIQADMIANQGVNYSALWRAFAKRGLGCLAVAPPNSTTVGVVESFTMPDGLLLTPAGGLAGAGPLLGGLQPGGQTYTLLNTTTNPLPWAAWVDVPWAGVSAAAGILAPAGGATNLVVAWTDAAAGLPVGNYSGNLIVSNRSDGAAQTRPVTLNVSAPQVAYFSLATDPGWARTGAWAFGLPAGRGGASNGNPDPVAGVSATNVFGVNLDGDYDPADNGAYYLTAGPLNFSGASGVGVQFERWLNTDAAPFAMATLDVSTDGLTWNNVWANGAAPITDAAWTPVSYDLSGWADQQTNVWVRWGYQVMWNAFAYSGWNLSAIAFTGLDNLTLELPMMVTKGAGILPGQGRVSLARPAAVAVPVVLTSSDPTMLLLPAQVTVPAGATQIVFDVTIPDDHLLTGTSVLAATAQALGCAPATNQVVVADNESATLVVGLPDSANQGGGALAVSLTASQAPAADISVTLQSSDPASLTVPAVVVLPAGATSVAFSASVPADARLLGAHAVSVTATAPGWPAGVGTMLVIGNTNTNLGLALPGQIRPSNGVLTNAGSVWLNGTATTNVIITLGAAADAPLTLPVGVVIPAGQTSAWFNCAMAGVTLPGGVLASTVTARAPGFGSATAGVNLVDDQTPAAVAYPLPADQTFTNPVNVVLSWLPGPGEGRELLVNGGFETGTLAGWSAVPGTNGGFVTDNGSLNPPSQDAPTVPSAGSYAATVAAAGANLCALSQDVAIPAGANRALLVWADRIRNFATGYGSNQQFRVELRATNDAVLSVLFATAPGLPLLNDWTTRGADLSAYAGRTVRLAFVVTGLAAFLDVHLDAVSLTSATLPVTTYDIYHWTNALATPRLAGSTTNWQWVLPWQTPGRTNAWSVTARRGQATPGPVWQFGVQPTIFVNAANVVRSPTAPTNLVFALRLVGGKGTVRVHFSTANGTAVAPRDYQATNGMVTFDPGVEILSLPIPVAAAASNAPAGNLRLVPANPVNAVLANLCATGGLYSLAGCPPALAALPDCQIAELSPLTFTTQATDAQAGAVLSYSLDPGAPAGAAIDATTGAFTWTPAKGQGPGLYWLGITVRDNNSPPRSATGGCLVTVTEINSPPTLAPPGNWLVHAGTLVTFTAQAAEANWPPGNLTFTLAPGAPASAAIDPGSGNFSWTPGVGDVGTNRMTIVVVDSLAPPLTAAQPFAIVVAPPPALGGVSLDAGGVTLNWPTLPGVNYLVQYTPDLNQPWTSLPGMTTGTGGTVTQTDSAPPAGQRFYRLVVVP